MSFDTIITVLSWVFQVKFLAGVLTGGVLTVSSKVVFDWFTKQTAWAKAKAQTEASVISKKL